MGAVEQLRDLLAPAVSSEGLELWDVEVTRSVVRVLIDRPDGIDLEALGAVTRDVINPLLDEHPDLTPSESFQLEVSSPGLERTLRTPDQYRRYLEREITVKTISPVAGGRRHHGFLKSVSEEDIQLAPKDGPAGTTVSIPLEAIDRARTVLEWGPAPKPSGARAASSAPSPKRSVSDPGSAVAATSAPTPEPKDSAS